MQFIKKITVVTIIGLILTLIVFWPVAFNLDSVTTSPNDGPLIAWLSYQVGELIIQNKSVYDLPFFFPYQNTLTYSDPFLPTALINLLLRPFYTDPILLLNFNLLMGAVICFVSMFLLADEMFNDDFASYIAATFFTFSLSHLEFAVHLHTFLIAGLPLGIYFLIRYIRYHQYGYLLGFWLAFLYQSLNAPMTGYFFASVAGLMIILEGWWRTLFKDQKFILYGFASVLLLIIFYVPYFSTAHELNVIRTIRDVAHSSQSVERLVQPDVLLVLGLILFLFAINKDKRLKNRSMISAMTLLVIIAVGATLMLGPVIKLGGATWKPLGFAIPLPYAAFYYAVPGMKAFRAASRWLTLFNFGTSLLIGWMIVNVQSRRKMVYVLTMVSAIIMVGFSALKIPYFHIDTQPPSIYQLVAAQPEQVLAELPAYLWDMTPYDSQADERLLYQVEHKKLLFNGVSGLVPPDRINEIQLLFTNFPDDQSIAMLKSNGVKLVLVHFDQYQQMFDDNFIYQDELPLNPSMLKDMLDSSPQFNLIDCVETACLYKLN